MDNSHLPIKETKLASSASVSLSSGLSSSKLKYLFPTARSLSRIYITDEMRQYNSIYNHQDLEQFTVCEGHRTVYENGVNKTYSYFLCPSNLMESSASHCCVAHESDQMYCCYPPLSYLLRCFFGSVFVAGLVLSILLYCCRNRCKPKQRPTIVYQPVTRPAASIQSLERAPYPSSSTYTEGFVCTPSSTSSSFPSQNFPYPPVPAASSIEPPYPPQVSPGWNTGGNKSHPPLDDPPPSYEEVVIKPSAPPLDNFNPVT